MILEAKLGCDWPDCKKTLRVKQPIAFLIPPGGWQFVLGNIDNIDKPLLCPSHANKTYGDWLEAKSQQYRKRRENKA